MPTDSDDARAENLFVSTIKGKKPQPFSGREINEGDGATWDHAIVDDVIMRMDIQEIEVRYLHRSILRGFV